MRTCHFCKGTVGPSQVRLIRQIRDKVVIVDDVPALVCRQCGEQYYEGPILERLDEILHNPRGTKKVMVPVVQYPGDRTLAS